MKKIYYIIGLYIIIGLYGCEDYLDRERQFEGLDQNDIFSEYQSTSDFLDGAYSYLITEISAVDGNADYLPGMTMSDEGYPGRTDRDVPEIYDLYAQGDYINLIEENAIHMPKAYTKAWQGIRIVNVLLEKVDGVPNVTDEEKNWLKGQAYFLRAYFYFVLTKRHGGMPYLKEPIDLNADLERVRDSYENNAADMLLDLNEAISFLPEKWDASNTGRPTKGAAMALKSRLLLYAASPLFNPSGNAKAWEDAASAASDMINHANSTGLYVLTDASEAITMDVDTGGADLLVPEAAALKKYRNIFHNDSASFIHEEIIFDEPHPFGVKRRNSINPNPRTSLVGTFNIMKGNQRPMAIGALANFVNRFETKNGLPINDDPEFDPQNPFINRDPRFYNAILFDGVQWLYVDGATNTTGYVDLAEVNDSLKLGEDLHSGIELAWRVFNMTGYMIRKWLPHGMYWNSGQNGIWDFYVRSIHFRMAEMYLNFAEAANEAYGPTGAVPGTSLTAFEAINIVRNRVGMPDVDSRYTGDIATFRERIHDERAVELCFEGHRYDDIRRWRKAHLLEYRQVKYLKMRWQGAKSATFPTGFSFDDEVQDQLEITFNEKHYFWPVPAKDLNAVKEFKQTPGW